LKIDNWKLLIPCRTLVRHGRVPPFGYSRIKGCLSPPRDFSQIATSFFVFWCLGIHRTLLSKLRTTKTLKSAFVLTYKILFCAN